MENNDALKWDTPRAFVQTQMVAPTDCDRFGHTNNVIYLRWLQDVAWAHTESLHLGFSAYERLGCGCVARRHELDYLAPTFAGDLLYLGTWISENDGRLTMWRNYQIIRAGDHKTVLRGRTQWVCVDMASGRPRRQPPEFVEAYRAAKSATNPE